MSGAQWRRALKTVKMLRKEAEKLIRAKGGSGRVASVQAPPRPGGDTSGAARQT